MNNNGRAISKEDHHSTAQVEGMVGTHSNNGVCSLPCLCHSLAKVCAIEKRGLAKCASEHPVHIER